jgi:hypothetical protein
MRARIIFAGGIVALSALAARAEDCRTIKDDGQRLACYDAKAAPAEPSEQSSDVWTFSESKSPVDDSPRVIAASHSADDDGKPAGLFMRCLEHRTELLVGSNAYWGLAAANGTLRVLFRINEDAAKEQDWILANSGTSSAVFFPNPNGVVSFLKALPATGKMFVRVTDFRGAPHDMTFKLDGLPQARDRVAVACKWPVH